MRRGGEGGQLRLHKVRAEALVALGVLVGLAESNASTIPEFNDLVLSVVCYGELRKNFFVFFFDCKETKLLDSFQRVFFSFVSEVFS